MVRLLLTAIILFAPLAAFAGESDGERACRNRPS